MINSHIEEQKKALPIGTFSLYAAHSVHEGMPWEISTVTLGKWIQDPKVKKRSKLPYYSPVNAAAKFIVKKEELSWQLPLLDQVLKFANEGKCDRLFRFISLGTEISSLKNWDILKNNCRLLRQEKAREVANV